MDDPRAFDIVMLEEDITIGRILEYLMHDLYYQGTSGTKPLIFCGFVKPHPHEELCILRVAFAGPRPPGDFTSLQTQEKSKLSIDAQSAEESSLPPTKTTVAEMLLSAAYHGERMFETIKTLLVDAAPKI